MTPNGAVIFVLVIIANALVARDLVALAVILALLLVFALASRRSIARALTWSAAIVLPLALLMALVWIVIIGRTPAEIAAGVDGSRHAAALYVAAMALRLFTIAFAVQAVMLHFADRTPLGFVAALAAPLTVKKLLVLTLSLSETILHAVERARTALIAGGIITRTHSWRNLRSGWLLVQSVWLTTLTTAMGRMRDKWPIENTLARLDSVLAAPVSHFAFADAVWIALAAVSLVAAIGLR